MIYNRRKSKKPLTPEEKEERRLNNLKRLQNYNPQSAAINSMRREFSRSPTVIDIMNDPATKRHVPAFKKDGSRAKVDAVEHLCSVCKLWKRSSKKRKVACDHIIPVVDPAIGFVDMNTYFARTWCDRSNLQKICGDCHHLKSTAENLVRRVQNDSLALDAVERLLDPTEAKERVRKYTWKRVCDHPQVFLDRLNALRVKLGLKPIQVPANYTTTP